MTQFTRKALVLAAATLISWALLVFVVILVSSLLSGCGSNYLLEEGNYSVTATVDITTDVFVASPSGGGFNSEWNIKHKQEGRYLLTMYTTEMYGADAHGISSFSLQEKQATDTCPFYTTLLAQLEPTDNGFTGKAYVGYTFCSQYDLNTNETQYIDWNTQYSVTGELQ